MSARQRRRGAPLVVIGDALLDRDLDGTVARLCRDAPVPVVDEPVGRARAGGAALAALLAARDGHQVVLVTALADDGPGRELASLLRAGGVAVVDLGLAGHTPEKVRIRTQGRCLLRMDYGGAPGSIGPLTDAARAVLREPAALLVSDYGRGLTAEPTVRRAVAATDGRCPVVWDPHPCGTAPLPGTRLVTPNRDEAVRLTPGVSGDGLAAITARARELVARFHASGVAVTLAAQGALLVGADGSPLMVPATAVEGDACGAGDRFAAQAAASLADGALTSEAVVEAVAAATAFVAAGAAAGSDVATGEPQRRPLLDSAEEIVEHTRRSGGVVVATGGCFDLLHAGHVRMLQAARELGDCLVVCLNSDASVRRLKGPDRPVVPEADRVAVLRGLSCVDGVAVFDEDLPEAVLGRLRPDVWAKGADYAVADLPEAPLVASWGGQAVVLPYLAGRSTSRILEKAKRNAHH